MVKILRSIQLKILDSKIGSSIPLPHIATDGSAGMDMRACIDEEVKVTPGETVLIPTGIAIYIADNKLAAVLLPKEREAGRLVVPRLDGMQLPCPRSA